MNHTIAAEGLGVRIRPVKMEDAPYLVWLRNLGHAKGKVGDSAMDVAGQEEWLRAYFQREGDYYFVVETLCGVPMGAFGIYDTVGDSAEFGRWIIEPHAPGALPGGILGIQVAFHQLGLRELRTKVVSTNQRVIQLEKKVGFRETQDEPSLQVIGGKPTRLIHMAMSAAEWDAIYPRMKGIAAIMASHIPQWERSKPLSWPAANP